MTQRVVLYGTPWCPYCVRARELLTRKGIQFEDLAVQSDPRLREEMEQRSGRRTVPQIFFGDRHIGGFDDLYALERAGKLDGLLAGLSQ